MTRFLLVIAFAANTAWSTPPSYDHDLKRWANQYSIKHTKARPEAEAPKVEAEMDDSMLPPNTVLANDLNMFFFEGNGPMEELNTIAKRMAGSGDLSGWAYAQLFKLMTEEQRGKVRDALIQGRSPFDAQQAKLFFDGLDAYDQASLGQPRENLGFFFSNTGEQADAVQFRDTFWKTAGGKENLAKAEKTGPTMEEQTKKMESALLPLGLRLLEKKYRKMKVFPEPGIEGLKKEIYKMKKAGISLPPELEGLIEPQGPGESEKRMEFDEGYLKRKLLEPLGPGESKKRMEFDRSAIE